MSAARYYNPHVERLSREEIEAMQLRKLQTFVELAYQRSDFYRRKLKAAKVEPEQIRSLEDFRNRIPTTTKREWLEDQAENSPRGSAAAVRPEQIVRYHISSGTSGIGQEVHTLTRYDIELSGSWTYGMHWAGIEPGDGFFNTLPIGLGNLAGPDSGIHSAVRKRLNVFNVGHLPAPQKLEYMKRFTSERPALLFIVPAYLQRLEAVGREQGFDFANDFNLKAILLAAEPYTVEWAQGVMDRWGVPLTELYGSTQTTSAMAFPCERGALVEGERGMLHFLEHITYPEFLGRDSGQPVSSGEEGELVVTSFERLGTPLLRWASDDRVRFVACSECPCGRPFHGVRAGEIARFDDMMKIKGVNVWPQAIDAIVLREGAVAEYAGEVIDTDAGTEVFVRIEFSPDCPSDRRPELLAALSQELREKIGVGMAVREAPEALPRFEFKVRRWTDNRQAGRQRTLYTERKEAE